MCKLGNGELNLRSSQVLRLSGKEGPFRVFSHLMEAALPHRASQGLGCLTPQPWAKPFGRPCCTVHL